LLIPPLELLTAAFHFFATISVSTTLEMVSVVAEPVRHLATGVTLYKAGRRLMNWRTSFALTLLVGSFDP